MQRHSYWPKIIGVLFAAVVSLTTIAAAPLPSAQASATGCNRSVCIQVIGAGDTVQSVKVFHAPGAPTYFGHHRVYASSRIIDGNGPVGKGPPQKSQTYNITHAGRIQICGEGWRHNANGSYTLMGRPCVNVKP